MVREDGGNDGGKNRCNHIPAAFLAGLRISQPSIVLLGAHGDLRVPLAAGKDRRRTSARDRNALKRMRRYHRHHAQALSNVSCSNPPPSPACHPDP